MERANSDFEGNRKEFWAFVGRRTKGKRRGITALRNSAGVSVTSTKGELEVFTFVNNRLVKHLDEGKALHKGQAGFRVGRGCVDNINTLNELMRFKLWEFGARVKMWRVIKKMYECSKSAVLLDGER